MRIIRREARKGGHDNQQPQWQPTILAAGFSIKVVEMCTGPKREAPDVVHLAQQ